MLHGSHAPNAADWAARELSLPIYPGLTEAEFAAVVRALDELISQ
jgi:dTDP-4-amino-4,6-dideoxygalactose transaminase